MGSLFSTSTVSSSSSRISSFLITESYYGAPIKLIFGTTVVAPVLIDYDDFTAVAHTTTTSSGGKGGSVTSSSTSYTYTVALAMALGEGTLTGTGNIWDGSTTTDASALGLTFFDGSLAQSVWGYMYTNHPSKSLTYSGTSYLAGVLDLGDSASLPNFNIECYGLCEEQQGTPTTSKVKQIAYTQTVEISNFSSNSYVEEYDGSSGWITLDSRYYSIDQKEDSYGNTISGVYIYTFNFDDRDDGYDRADPLYIRIHYTALAASVTYTATDANPADIIYTLLTSTVYGENFPEQLVDDLSDYKEFCNDNSLLISPAYDTTTELQQIIEDLTECTNSEYVFSQGKAKMIPYYDDLDPLYNITDDDLINQGDDTISTTRTDMSDIYNIIPLEYYNRNDSYNTNVVYATDEGHKDLYGIRQASTKSHHEITSASLAQTVAQTILQRQLYVRNTHVVKLPQAFILLEPMDPVTLACTFAGLEETAVRVVSIKESGDDYTLEVTLEDNPTGVATAGVYDTQDTNRASTDLKVDPGDVNYPVIFEAPNALVTSGLGYEVWIYLSGGDYFGGASVWASSDGTTYKKVGTLSGKSRQGILTTALPTGDDPDETNTPTVDLSMSDGTLASGTQSDADSYNILCYIGGELISYETATLTDTNTYQLSYLRRGIYNSTISSHSIKSQFVRMDDNVFQYPFTEDDIGKTIYLKFTSFNVFDQAEQDLSDVAAYQYTITGSALSTNPDDVENLTDYYQNSNLYLSWDAVSDFRGTLAYEIRKGDTWSSAQVMGQTYNTTYQVQGNGTYFVAAVYSTYYSETPAEITITGARYTSNVIAEYDECDTGWLGTRTTGVGIRTSDNALYLTGAGSIDDATSFDDISNIDYYGGVTSTGTYTIPESHRIDVGTSSLCNVTVNYTGIGDTINDTFDLIDDVDSITNWDGDYSSNVSFQVQIRTADDDETWSDWKNFYVGQYNARIFDFRIILNSSDSNTTAIVSCFSFTVDVPDISESKQISIPADGTTITYENTYHTIPYPQITIYNASDNDDVILTDLTQTSFTVQVTNGGTGVIRSALYLVQSY